MLLLNKKLAVFLIIIGLIGFVGGVVYSVCNFDWRNIELPLSFPQSIVVDSKGCIYCGLEFYSRVQVYSANGKFLKGWNIHAESKDFRIYMDDQDFLHVITYVQRLEHVFDRNGALLQSKEVQIDTSEYFRNISSRYQFKAKNGYIYKIKGFIFHRIARIDAKGVEKIIISTPLILNLFSFPFCWFIFAAGVLINLKNYYNDGKYYKKRKKQLPKLKEIVNEADFNSLQGQLPKSHIGIYWFSWLLSLIVAFTLRSSFRHPINLALIYIYLVWIAIIIIRFYEDFRFVKYMKEYHADKWNESLKIWGKDSIFANLRVVKLVLSSKSANNVVSRQYKHIHRHLLILPLIVFFTFPIVLIVITSPPWAVATWNIIKMLISGGFK